MTAPAYQKLSKTDKQQLIKDLYDHQQGLCYIDETQIDLSLPVDVDHIRSTDQGGHDDKNNWGLTHASCNRGKGNRDLQLMRHLSRFRRARDGHRNLGGDDDDFTLGVALAKYGGAKRDLVGTVERKESGEHSYRFTVDREGQQVTRGVPIDQDLNNSNIQSFTTVIPIEYVYHDASINPRSIVDLEQFIEEFYRGHPQLLPSLAHLEVKDGRGRVQLFDGQHKAAAELFLGHRSLYVRVFVDADLGLLKTTNFSAHTKLAQIHFPMAIQDKVGHDIYLPDLQTFLNQAPDRAQLDERSFFASLSAEDRSAMRDHFRGYLKFRVVNSVSSDKDNFFDFVEMVSARSKVKPLAYETVRRAIFNQLLYLYETNTKLDVAEQMRDHERDNLVRLLRLFTDKLLAGKFKTGLGIAKLEQRLADDDPAITDDHLRAYRVCRQAPLVVIIGELRGAIRQLLSIRGRYLDGKWPNEGRYLWAEMQPADWAAIDKMLDLVLEHKVWIERNRAHAETLQDNRKGSWEEILLNGRLPGAENSVYEPLTQARLLQAAI